MHPVAHTGPVERAVCDSMKCCAFIQSKTVADAILSGALRHLLMSGSVSDGDLVSLRIDSVALAIWSGR